jgi:hypothetical protein
VSKPLNIEPSPAANGPVLAIHMSTLRTTGALEQLVNTNLATGEQNG